MANQLSAEQILDAMRVPSDLNWDVYQVGCSSSPLNFASQQLRAFMLTRALDEKKLITGKDVAVIGAGLTGLTAAISCLFRGAKKVTLIERNHDLMALQLGTTHRYVHPFIYRWPKKDAEASRTGFPVLNWSEGTADSIRAQFLDELHRLFRHYYNSWLNAAKDRIKSEKKSKNSKTPPLVDKIGKATVAHHKFDVDMELTSEFLHYRLGTKVMAVIERKSRLRLNVLGPTTKFDKDRNEFVPKGDKKEHEVDCDLVIAAVGFGLEKELKGVPFKSYWQQDTLSQATIRDPYPRRWLVMGTGAGGSIDAVRLRLFDSNQKLLTDILTGQVSPPIHDAPTRERWSELIGEFRRELEKVDVVVRRRIGLNRMDREDAMRYEIRNRVSRELHEEYERICNAHREVFAWLDMFIGSRKRTDTVVYLSGRWDYPYEFNAAPFERFLVYLVCRSGDLKYQQGTPEIIQSPVSSGAPYRYRLDSANAALAKRTVQEFEVDEIVVRYGAVPALDYLFGEKTKEDSQKNKELVKLDEAIENDQLPDDWLQWPLKPVIPKWKPKK